MLRINSSLLDMQTNMLHGCIVYDNATCSWPFEKDMFLKSSRKLPLKAYPFDLLVVNRKKVRTIKLYSGEPDTRKLSTSGPHIIFGRQNQLAW